MILWWKNCPPCPVERAEGGGIQLGRNFYILGGFRTIDQVSEQVHVLDLENARWVDQFPMHPEVRLNFFTVLLIDLHISRLQYY